MIYCPKCGYQHEARPIPYILENEAEVFAKQLKEYQTDNGTVKIPSAHVEAGPFNGDRYLMDYDVKACSCPKCNATFYIEE